MRAVFIDSSIYYKGEWIDHLKEKGFRVFEFKRISETGLRLLQRIKVDLVVMKPYRAMGRKYEEMQRADDLWARALVLGLRDETSANRETPIIAYSRCRMPESVDERFSQYNITRVSGFNEEEFHMAVDCVLTRR